MKNRYALSGFTLLELLITLVIIGILVGIAVPSYQKSVIKTNRSDAKTKLLDTAQRLQRCYTTYGKYTGFATINDCAVFQALTTNGSKITTDAGFYDITLSNNTQSTFTLTATAVKNPQTKDFIPQCLQLTVNQSGAKGDANGISDTCW